MKYDELISKLCERAPWCPDTEAKLMAEAANAIADLISALKASNDVIVKNKPKWIPVTERLPDYNKAVLCHCRANIIETLCLDNDGHWYGYSGRFMKGFVTHWMPLPEPPKEETDG